MAVLQLSALKALVITFILNLKAKPFANRESKIIRRSDLLESLQISETRTASIREQLLPAETSDSKVRRSQIGAHSHQISRTQFASSVLSA
jgi:hypothetical protein